MSGKEKAEKEKSSYLKGIDRLLENSDMFEREIIDYILSVNSKFHSNTFPTTQLAKILLEQLKFKQTQYPIIHKVIREIFKKWADEDICTYVSTAKAGRNRRTKDIYKFNEDQIKILKGKLIESSIEDIQDDSVDPKKEIQQMKTREEILRRFHEHADNIISEILDGDFEDFDLDDNFDDDEEFDEDEDDDEDDDEDNDEDND